MGGTTFMRIEAAETAGEAFELAKISQLAVWRYKGVQTAQLGDTGSVCEKEDFVAFERSRSQCPMAFARDELNNPSSPVYDKWGPAGVVSIYPYLWLVFGWANT